MGSDLSTIVKALSKPCESAVHDCAQISSESDCSSGCCTCHTKTIARDDDDDDGGTIAPDTLAGRETEIERPSKSTA